MSSKKTPPALSDSQIAIMHVLWDREEATLGEIWAEVTADRPLAKNTVQTLLTRLVEKGWVNYRDTGKGFLYRSAQGRRAARKQILNRVLDAAFQGSTEGLVMTLLETRRITPEEAARLRALIDAAEEGS